MSDKILFNKISGLEILIIGIVYPDDARLSRIFLVFDKVLYRPVTRRYRIVVLEPFIFIAVAID